MTDNTAVSLQTIIAETQRMIANGEVGPAAEYAFGVFESIVENYRENRSSDKPSMKKAAEAFEPTNELEEAAADVLAEIRQIVFREISQSPELSVLLYQGLKDYAQDHVKEYRDAVLRGVLGELIEDTDDEDDYVLPLSREELLSLKTHVESLAKLAENFGQSADLPVREKTGNIKFANTKGYGEDAAVSSDVDVTKFTYSLDGEEIPASTLADVALWHVSSANEVYTPSDIMRLVRAQHGNKVQAEGWAIDVNGRVLEAKPVGN